MRSSRQNPLARKVPLAEYAMKLTGVVSFVRQLAPAIHYSFEERFRKQQILLFIDSLKTLCFSLKLAFDAGINFSMTFSTCLYIFLHNFTIIEYFVLLVSRIYYHRKNF